MPTHDRPETGYQFEAALRRAGDDRPCARGVLARDGLTEAPAPDALRVVATTTVFADIVGAIGGSHVTVDSIDRACGVRSRGLRAASRGRPQAPRPS